MSFGYEISPLLWEKPLYSKILGTVVELHASESDFNTLDSVTQDTLNNILDRIESKFLG